MTRLGVGDKTQQAPQAEPMLKPTKVNLLRARSETANPNPSEDPCLSSPIVLSVDCGIRVGTSDHSKVNSVAVNASMVGAYIHHNPVAKNSKKKTKPPQAREASLTERANL